MKLIKTIAKCATSIIESSTQTIERSLSVVDNLVEAGEILAVDFKEETEFDVSKSRTERAKAMAKFKASLEELSPQDAKE